MSLSALHIHQSGQLPPANRSTVGKIPTKISGAAAGVPQGLDLSLCAYNCSGSQKKTFYLFCSKKKKK
uniref:Uncharacterized protein n=1 Tax=Ascaris lumbricoides TaxID=6252 RepID=A0A0M3ISZ0_ASCLU